jgi:hypothetical protein
MYTTSCGQSDVSKCDKNTQNFEKARKEALKSKDPKVRAAAKAYGEYGAQNRVKVDFTTSDKSHTGFAKDENGKAVGVNVTINSNMLSGIATDSSADAHVLALADVAHEGSHVQTDTVLLDNGLAYPARISNRQSEVLALRVSSAVAQEHGKTFLDAQGHPIDISTDQKVNNFLKSLPKNPNEDLNAPIYDGPP